MNLVDVPSYKTSYDSNPQAVFDIPSQNVYPSSESTQDSSAKSQTVPDFSIIFPAFSLTGTYESLSEILTVAWTITSSHVP